LIFQFNSLSKTGWPVCFIILAMLCLQPVQALENKATTGARPAIEPLERVLALIDERLKLIPDVAKYKWNTHGKIEDLQREQEIITALGQQATQLGLPVTWTEQFFRAQIESSKTIQRELFQRWRNEKIKSFDNVPELAKVTRPKLDALTPQLLDALVLAWLYLQNPAYLDEVRALIAQKLDTSAYSRLAADTASAPLIINAAGH